MLFWNDSEVEMCARYQLECLGWHFSSAVVPSWRESLTIWVSMGDPPLGTSSTTVGHAPQEVFHAQVTFRQSPVNPEALEVLCQV